jgi:hypothetical protein
MRKLIVEGARNFIEPKVDGLLKGFSRVFGVHDHGVSLPGLETPRLIVRGHDAFCLTTGWRMNRFQWETIRNQIGANVMLIARDAPRVPFQRRSHRDFMRVPVRVDGQDIEARYSPGLEEFLNAFGFHRARMGHIPTASHWAQMWKRTGETSMLVFFTPSQLNHGEVPRI